MHAYDYDEPDSSQATKMIQDILVHDNSPSKPGGSSLKYQQSNEMPDSPSETSHSIPQYHFHGLAQTQSQTQSQHYGEEDEPQEGSQKENIGAVKTSKESPPSRSGSPQASSSRAIGARLATTERKGAAASTGERGVTKKATNVTFQSPRPKGGMGATANKTPAKKSPYKSTVQTTSRYKQPPRPPVRSNTQDSFANEPLDQGGLILATAGQFALPLSEFTKDSPVRDTDTSGGTSNDSMYAYPKGNRRLGRSSPPQGRILVDATPSCSSQSQSQSQKLEESQGPQNQLGLEMDVDKDGNTSDAESSRSLGSKHHDNEDFDQHRLVPHPDLIPTQSSARGGIQHTQPSGDIQHTQPSGEFEGTQPSGEFVGTQPSTQVDESNFNEPEDEAGMSHFSRVQEILRTTSSNPSGPRSLLGMVRPENQWRYRQYGSAQNSAPSGLAHNSLTNNMNNKKPSPPARSDLQETQPSFPEAPIQRRGFPSKTLTSTTTATTNIPATLPADSMEVVPDSEPGRLGARASSKQPTAAVPTPAKTLAAGSSPEKKGKGKAPAVDVEMKDVDETNADNAEDDDDDDVPLATAAAALVKRPRGHPPSKKAANNKGKEKEHVPPPPPPTIPQKSNPPTKAAQKPIAPTKTNARSWETGVVPSSLPEQDIPQGGRTTRNRPTVIAEPKKATPRGPQSKQSARPNSNAPRSRQSEEVSAGGRNGNDDDATELADEEYQDADVDGAGPARKRKRASPDKASTPANNTRTATKRAKRGAATPVARATPRAGASATKQNASSKATRVFALWQQDGHYYSGTVHAVDDHSQYSINFDDGTTAWVTLNHMRSCELHIGDDVLFEDRNRPSEVINVDEFKDGIVQLLVDGEVEEREVKELRISATSIYYGWDDRKLSPQTVSTSMKPSKKQSRLSPSPSKASIVSLPLPVHNKHTKLLAETGFIVTLTTLKKQWERELVMNDVKSTGGSLIDDWNSVLRMDGQLSEENNRWTLRKEDAQWVGASNITRMLLIADDCNYKPKFLFALALGIPCVSTKWLQECVKTGESQEFLPYLLPQGFSETLRATVTQQINIEWGASAFDIPKIMSNTVARRLFGGKSIICIGADMVLQPKPPGSSRKVSPGNKAIEAQNSIPRIILAMGAEVVEVVTAAQYASKALSSYDYLLIKTPKEYLSEYSESTVVHWAWVKDCIVASRLHPLPVWTVEEEASQEL